jgi:hypothetical protein
MKKAIAILFLTLYAYNLAGYYVVFKTLQVQVRGEMRDRIKRSLDERELTLISVPRTEKDGLHWIDDHEFRHRGSMYDIVRTFSRNDTIHYLCINDKYEEQLFEGLDLHVSNESNAAGIPQKAAAPFKGITKEYTPQVDHLPHPIVRATFIDVASIVPPPSFVVEVPSPPPRHS